MIFKIDESCLEAIDKLNNDAISALEMLALNRKKGKNIIFAEKCVLEVLKECACFSLPVKFLFRSLLNNAIENKLYFKGVNKYINIVNKIDGNRVGKKDNNVEEFKVTLDELSQVDISDYTEFITENQDDAEFYKLITRYYVKSKSIKVSSEFDFELKPGGGDTIAKILELEIKNKRRLLLCIVDSDIKYPSAGKGSTIEHVEGVIEKEKEGFWKVIFLDVHEIENLLPLCWVEECTEDTVTSSDTIKFLRYLIETDKNRDKDKAIYYFDMKKGIEGKRYICSDTEDENKMKEYRKNENFRKFWTTYLKGYGIAMDNLKSGDIISGFGNKVLSKVLEKYEKEREFPKIDKYIEDRWLLLGKDIFSWGCVGRRIN